MLIEPRHRTIQTPQSCIDSGLTIIQVKSRWCVVLYQIQGTPIPVYILQPMGAAVLSPVVENAELCYTNCARGRHVYKRCMQSLALATNGYFKTETKERRRKQRRRTFGVPHETRRRYTYGDRSPSWPQSAEKRIGDEHIGLAQSACTFRCRLL